MNSEQHIALLQKKVNREKAARAAAEKLLEVKSLELYNAKLLIEESVEKLQNKANLDSERLAYQTKIETMLLSYGRRFLKQAPNAEVIQDLVQSLVDSNSVTACCIHIFTESQIENSGQYDYGRRQNWLPPEQLKQDKHVWDNEEHTYWIALRNSHNILIGFLAARISATGSWLESIKKHMALFSEMLRSAISRQIILANAITARKRAENSEQATRDFLAMINHELRTPLNGLLGTAELLGDSPLNSDQTKLLTTLNHSGELLRAIINDLLDYSKINAGMLELTEKPFDSHLLAIKMQDIFNLRASEKRLTFNFICSPAVPKTLNGDEDRIKQIFVNLISNAIKFTEQGSVVALLDWRNDKLYFEVKDSGCGISLSQQSKLFKPFSQVDISSKRSHEGTGLGLAICKQLTEQMHGTVRLESERNAGATFIIELPLVVVEGEVINSQPTHYNNKRLENKTVLVVEDLKTNQMIIKLMLSKIGICPVIVDNGAEAVDILEQQSFDIVLMDCRMPIMDGYCATRQLRSDNYIKPIIALTAGTTTAEREECLRAGMNDILCKPYQSVELKSMLAKWCV